MSFSELLREYKKLKALLAERDAQLTDRDAVIEQLAGDLKTLKEQVLRLLESRCSGHLIAAGQEVLFPEQPLASEEAGDETPEHADEAPDAEAAGDHIKRRHRPKSPAKKIDTSTLQRVDRVHELPEEERFCPESGLSLVAVDEKTFDEIDYEPARIFIVHHRQIIYGLAPEDALERQAKSRTAPMPPRPLEGCSASANLLARTLVQKYASHLPLYRQQEIFARDGLRLPRQTMCDWVMGAAQVLQPIADRVMDRIRAGPVTQLDDTPVMCQGGKGKKHFQAYLWTFMNPEVEGVAYRFTSGRGSDLIAKEIEGVEGYLVGDGYSGNTAAARKVSGEIIMAGCWAHTTRKFKDALSEVPGTAQLFREDIQQLYEIEDEANALGLSPHERRELRSKKSRTILAEMLARCRRLHGKYSDAGLMAKALGYLKNQRKPLRRFLEDGRVPLDNNPCERSIRPIAIGRRNWLFAGSVRGGQAAATIYTLIECCRLADINMERYLADVLVRIATHPASQIDELLPENWEKLAAQASPVCSPLPQLV